MRLPRLMSVPKRVRQQMLQFGGINYSEANTSGELAFAENVRSDLYPCLSPRLGRVERAKLTEPNGIFAGDDLFYIDGDVIYRNGEVFGEFPTQGEDSVRKLLLINSKLVVFPDKVYFNLDDKADYELTERKPSDWEEGYTNYFTKNADTEEFEAVPAVDTAPTWTAGRYYRYVPVRSLDSSFEFLGATLAFDGNKIRLRAESGYYLRKGELINTTPSKWESVYTYTVTFDCESGALTVKKNTSAEDAEEVNKGDYVIAEIRDNGEYIVLNPDTSYADGTRVGEFCAIEKILARSSSSVSFESRAYDKAEYAYDFKEGFRDLFKPGDAVKISGCFTNEENNLTLVIRDVTATELIFDENVFTANDFELGAVTIEREVPDFDVVCEHNNRLWGASEDKIYASALGDPTNFNLFDGLASDSYTVAVAGAGRFTGCIGYSGNVLFFKEDMMYKVMGDYPSSFAIYSYNVAGVCEGSAGSLVNLGERLFYHSRDGVYVYTGSVPSCISHNFGTRRFENAVAAGFGTKYYISVPPSAGRADSSLVSSEQGSPDSGLYVYDTLRDIWLREDNTEVIGFAERGGEYFMLTPGGALMQVEADEDSAVSWSAELCELTEYINERKCYSKLLLRLDMDLGSSARVEVRCDRGEWRTVWERPPQSASADSSPIAAPQGSLFGEGEFRNAYTANIVFRPTRCDRFSIRLSGAGKVIIRSLIREYEMGSEV